MIGYSHIFYYTDNGSEFTAEKIVGMLKRWNQTILTVTGRPQNPSDHGSVEIINRFAKWCALNSVLASEDQNGKLCPNWTKYLGEVNLILNNNVVKPKMMVLHMKRPRQNSIHRWTTIQARVHRYGS